MVESAAGAWDLTVIRTEQDALGPNVPADKSICIVSQTTTGNIINLKIW